MKTDFMKRLTSLIAALALVFSIAIPSTIMAEGEGDGDGTGEGTQTVSQDTKQITLHKLLLTEEQLSGWKSPTDYNATQDLEALKQLNGMPADLKEIPNVYFAFKNADDEWIDANGNVVTDFNDALGGLTTTTGLILDTSTLPAGEYKIHEVPELSTYVGKDGATLTGAKAVPVEITLPIINNDGPVALAHVYPKNTENPPTVVKEAKEGEGTVGSEATLDKNVGDKIEYVITTNIPKDTKYKTLRWSDEMTKGLTYNKDLVIKTKKGTVETVLATTDYKFIYVTDVGFKVELTEAGLEKVNGKGPLDIILEYSATINTTAVVDQADTNKIVLDYSNKPTEENEPPTITDTTEIPVRKTWAEGEAPEGVKVIVGLYENTGTAEEPNWKLIETKELNNGNGFYEVFEGLDTGKQYKVIENEITGYTPEYSYSSAEGEGKGLTIHNKKKDYPSIEDEGPEIVTHGKKFVKKAGTTEAAESLAGAKFYIRDADNGAANYLAVKTTEQQAASINAYNTAQTAYIDAITRYNELLGKDTLTPEEQAEKTKLEGDVNTEGSIAKLKKIRDEEYKKSQLKYYWEKASAGKAPANAVVLASDLEGNFEIKGIKAGTYYLEEFETPSGYAKITKRVEFTVGPGTYEGEGSEIQIVENKKVDIPQTGGMGTILFTIAGLGIMALAFVMLRKKNNEA